MPSPYEDGPDDKFDQFIRNFDETLETDTSTIKTIGRKSSQQFKNSITKDNLEKSTEPVRSPTHQKPSNVNINSRKITSPVLSTPTKPNRKFIPLDSQPLHLHSAEETDFSFDSTPIDKGENGKPFTKKSSLLQPPSTENTSSTNAEGDSLRRSNTTSSAVRSGAKRGLNLNLPINKQSTVETSPSVNRLRSPETPTVKNNVNSPSRHNDTRRRASSGLSSHSSVTQDFKDNDFNDSLRELALKEMKIIELKDQMKLLQRRIDTEEKELQGLKAGIANTLKELSTVQNPKSNTPISTPTVSQMNHRDRSPVKNTSIQTPSLNETQNDTNSKRSSVWSKPINFLNQFDQILQNEIEKLNRDTFPPQQFRQHPAERLNEQDDITAKDKSDDVLNTVSNSIWSFVSDVKNGLLGDDTIDQKEHQQQKHEVGLPQQNQHATVGSKIHGLRDSIDTTDDHEQEMISIERKDG